MEDRYVVMDTTTFCGADCIICPRAEFLQNHSCENMPDNIFKKTVDECYKDGIRVFDFGAFGDPLLDVKLKEHYSYIKSNYSDAKITVTSTCQMLQGEIASVVAEYVDAMKISHYGFSKKSYESVHRGGLKYESVKKNILDFLERKKRPEVIISLLILDETKDEIDEWKEFWEPKADKVLIWYPHNFRGAKKHLVKDNYENRSIIRSCGRPGKDFTVKPNGDVCICCVDFDHRLVVGNIKHESWTNIINGEESRRIIEKHQKNDYSGLLCEQCDMIYDRVNSLYYSSDNLYKVGVKCTTPAVFTD